MRKFEFISSLSRLAGDFADLAQREIQGEDAKICQSYVQLRNLVQEWTVAIVSSNRSRKTRIISTSRVIIFNLIENIDRFLEQRLKNISKITDLNMLDKDSLKNLSHGSELLFGFQCDKPLERLSRITYPKIHFRWKSPEPRKVN